MEEAEKKRNPDKDRASSPPGWPNIPGRSLEHDGEPDVGHKHEGSSDLTEAQRELERNPPK
jgi:hypothetical protein